MTPWLQLLANGLINGALYAMLAVGFGIVWRSLRIFHLAYGGLFVACGHLFYSFRVLASCSVGTALLITLVLAGLLGCLMEWGLYRPLSRVGASSGAVLIASLGVFVVLENLIALVFGNDLKTVSAGAVWVLDLGPVGLTGVQLAELVTGAAVVALVWALVRKSRTFKALWALGDQPDLILALGLPYLRLRLLVLMTSTVLVAIPACLITLDVGVTPHIGMSYLLIAAVAVIVGGMQRYSGWICGALVLAFLQVIVVWLLSARWMDLVTFSLLVTMLLFRPRGFLADRERLEESQ